ncbi:MAG: protein kinase [Myxococcaceae bacterium]|nr:protein kinase [Myxococcaceae bacterium]
MAFVTPRYIVAPLKFFFPQLAAVWWKLPAASPQGAFLVTKEPTPTSELLYFESARDFQQAWEAKLHRGTCFIATGKVLFAGAPFNAQLKINGVAEAPLAGHVVMRDTDAQGQPGLILGLSKDCIAQLNALYQRTMAPPEPEKPAPEPAVMSSATYFPPSTAASPATVPAPPASAPLLPDIPEVAEPPPAPAQTSATQLIPVAEPAVGEPGATSTGVGLLDTRMFQGSAAPQAKTLPEAKLPEGLLATMMGASAAAPEPAASAKPTTPAPSAAPNTPSPSAPSPTAPGGEDRMEPGSVLDNRFQIEGHLASGGMGDVYRAAHIYLKRPIALKLLKRSFAGDQDMWARFQREAELVSQLESPFIVRVFDFGRTSSGQPFLAMELVDGITLDQLLEREKQLTPERAITLMTQVCEGLHEAHAMGIIHRDLKPPNIILGKRRDGSEVAKILDFGIARLADTTQQQASLTQMGMVVGTPAYLAPEQALADVLDARTDIYALGCVLFELLTGRPPFVTENLQKLVAMHLTEAPPDPVALRPSLAEYPALCAAVLKALQKDRTQRFQDIRAFAQGIAAKTMIPAVPPPSAPPPPASAPQPPPSVPQPPPSLPAPFASLPAPPSEPTAPAGPPSTAAPVLPSAPTAPQVSAAPLPPAPVPVAVAAPAPAAASPSAFDDWGAPEQGAPESAPVQGKSEEWPPPEVAQVQKSSPKGPANASFDWPPPEQLAELEPEPDTEADSAADTETPTAASPKKAPSLTDELHARYAGDAFYQAESASPSKAKRLEAAFKALKLKLPKTLADGLMSGRAALAAGSTRGVVLHIEVLGISPSSALAARCWEKVLAVGHEHQAVLDAVDEDGAVWAFADEQLFGAAGRAAFAALAMREAVREEVTGTEAQASGSVRAALGGGKMAAHLSPDKPLQGDLTQRLRTLVARGPAGKVLVERALAAELEDVTEVKSLSLTGFDVVEAVDRKLLLNPQNAKLVGRDAQLTQLDRRLQSLAQGVVAPVLLVGAPGSGRSVMARELALRARQHQFVVMMARALPSLKNVPYGAFIELVCNACGVPKEDRATHLRPALEAMKLGPAELETALVISGIKQQPQPFTPGQAILALRMVLNAAAPQKHILYIFDGLEQMDAYSVDAFRELCARPRPKELTAGFTETNFAREKLPNVPTIELGPLSPYDIEMWVSTQLGSLPPSEKLLDLLKDRSGGMPAKLVDWLHVLADMGYLRFKGGGIILSGEPGDWDDAELTRLRVRGVGPDGARLFEAAALAGDTVDGPLLGTLVPQASQAAYQRLVASQLLRALGGKRWAISSERYASQVMATSSPQRAALHLRFASVLWEQARTQGKPPDLPRVAEHLTQAREANKALALWRTAAESAINRNATRDALLALKGGADCLAQLLVGPAATAEGVKVRVDTLARAAAFALLAGDPALARVLVDEAEAVGKEKKVVSPELALSLARVLRSEARRARAAEALDKAEQLSQGTLVSALCAAERGEAREAEGDLGRAQAAFEKAMAEAPGAADLARWHGEVNLAARVQARLASVLLSKKDVAAARNHYLGSLSAYRQEGYPYGEARVLANLGALCAQSKENTEAAQFFEEAAATAAKGGDFLFQARQLIYLARVQKKMNHIPLAKKTAENAKRLANALGWEEGRKQAEGIFG